MDKREIERKIISGVIGESQYNRVKFLRAEDFRNYGNGYDYRDWWNVIVETNGHYHKVLSKFMRGDKLNAFLLNHTACVADYTEIDRLGLLLLELNWREYLKYILMKSLEQTTDTAEIESIMRVYKESDEIDVFDLLDWVPEYLEPSVSISVKSKLDSWKRYSEVRIKEVQQWQVSKAS